MNAMRRYLGGDTVYTSDFDDMTRVATKVPGVRVLGE
jgi:hypothetical protein